MINELGSNEKRDNIHQLGKMRENLVNRMQEEVCKK